MFLLSFWTIVSKDSKKIFFMNIKNFRINIAWPTYSRILGPYPTPGLFFGSNIILRTSERKWWITTEVKNGHERESTKLKKELKIKPQTFLSKYIFFLTRCDITNIIIHHPHPLVTYCHNFRFPLPPLRPWHLLWITPGKSALARKGQRASCTKNVSMGH